MQTSTLSSDFEFPPVLSLVGSELPYLEEDPDLDVVDMEDLICTMHKELLDIKRAFHKGNPTKVQKEFVDMLGKGMIIYQRCILSGVFIRS